MALDGQSSSAFVSFFSDRGRTASTAHLAYIEGREASERANGHSAGFFFRQRHFVLRQFFSALSINELYGRRARCQWLHRFSSPSLRPWYLAFAPPPDVRDAHAHGSRVSCLLCFQRRPARDSTMEHGATSTIDGDLAVEKTAQLEWWWSPTLFFSFVGSFGSPPGHHASKQHTDRDKNGGVLGVLFSFSLS